VRRTTEQPRDTCHPICKYPASVSLVCQGKVNKHCFASYRHCCHMCLKNFNSIKYVRPIYILLTVRPLYTVPIFPLIPDI
jgi:hypothetical protein